MEAAAAFRRQAAACTELGSPMYAVLLAALADDIAAGGVTRDVLAGYENPPSGAQLPLRLMGSVHRLVLSGAAPELAAHYPSMGGAFDLAPALEAFLDVERRQAASVREWLDRPPQTNEVGRAAALFGAVLHLPEPMRLPVRLFEIGASAGLNLRADRFAYVGPSRTAGDPDSPVRLDPAWTTDPPAWHPQIVARAGADLRPVDVSTAVGRLALRSYVWADQAHRLQRLDAAVTVASQVPATVHERDAVSFVADLDLADGTTTVLWHSVFWQYVPREAQAELSARIAGLAARATSDKPFAHISLEPVIRKDGNTIFPVTLRTWPDGSERAIGEAPAHGVPITWLP